MHKENWLFKFENDNSGFIYLSFSDVVDSGNFYHGVILNRPSIRESIDLAKSTSKTSNITINIPDFSYQGSPISEELFGGSNHYINQTVSVYSNDTSTQIGSFRLIDIATDGNKINLGMTSHRPWDFISIPQTKSDSGVYAPVAYGDFTKNTIGTTSSFLTSKALFPCINANYAINNNAYFIYPKTYASDAKPHFFDSNIDKFIPFTDSADATATQSGVDTVGVNIDMERGYFLIRPFGISGWANSANAIDTSTSTPANSSTNTGIADPSETLTDTATLNIDIPTVDGELIELYVYVKGEITHTDTSGNTSSALRVNSGTMISRTTTGTTSTSGYTINGVSGYSRIDAIGETSINVNLYTSASGSEPSTFGEASATSKVYDIVLRMKVKNDTTGEKTASLDKLAKLKNVYSGADGLTFGITDAAYNGNAITEIHEAHLDLLNRFTGLDPTDIDDDIEGWTSLNSAKNWEIRWWMLKNVELQKVLEKLQYEGGFIFRYKSDGSPQYIFVPDSPSATDTLTKHDLADISIKHTPFSELLTKMEISYEKHPAEDKHLSSSVHEDSSSPSVRDNWNIQTKENVQQVKLDAYISPTIPTTPDANPNDDFYTYYNNIFGDIRIMVSATVVNSDYFDLEVGQIIDFDDMYPEKAFGEAWSGKKFIITSTVRTVDKLSIEAREI